MITQSESVKNLYAALVAAQGELQTVAKDAKNPYFKSSYATLEAVIDAIRPVYAKHELAIVQFPVGGEDGKYGVETRICHSSGEWMSATAFMKPVKDDPQGAGSTITYLRRYSAQSVAFLAAADDDGNDASGNRGEKPETRKVPVDKESVASVLADISSLMHGLDAEKRAAVSELVFKGKKGSEIKAMPLEALTYALTEIKRYAAQLNDDPEKFWGLYKEAVGA